MLSIIGGWLQAKAKLEGYILRKRREKPENKKAQKLTATSGYANSVEGWNRPEYTGTERGETSKPRTREWIDPIRTKNYPFLTLFFDKAYQFDTPFCYLVV
ncbi:MAG: hypothetical protein M1429_03480 [Patescibacteria group bacterium]|nr:hypothetical protein [Patescibacteria group bacterium]